MPSLITETPIRKRILPNAINSTPTRPTPRKRKRTSTPETTQHLLATVELLNDLTNFIALGTLDIPMPRRAAPGMETPDGWLWLETQGPKCGFSKHSLEGRLVALVEAGWVRCTYCMLERGRVRDRARVRVYVLPDDVGRTYIQREDAGLRRCLKAVVAATDGSRLKWTLGKERDEVVQKVEETASLFYMFNKLESPRPDPKSFWIKDENTKDLLHSILTHDHPEIKTTLYRYQKQTVAMMAQKELAPEQTMDPRLTQVHGPEGVYFHDMETSEIFQDPRYFEDVKGGILAEEMGTGKTLLCIALILATKHQTPFFPEEYEQAPTVRPRVGTLMQMCIGSIWRNAVPWKQYIGTDDLSPNCSSTLLSSPGYYEVTPPPRSRSARYDANNIPKEKIYLGSGTIVVCPQNLVVQWQGEVNKHLQAGALKVLVLENSKDQIPEVQELLGYDVVIFSRSRFDKEAKEGLDMKGRRESGGKSLVCRCTYVGATRTPDCTCFRREEAYKSPLMSIHWKRLIVDEGHSMAAGSKINSVLVAEKLPVERRWIVTGTPTSELVGLMAGTDTTDGDDNDDDNEDNEARMEKLLQDRKELRINEAAQLERVGKMVCDFLRQEPWTLPQWRRYMNPARMKAMLEKFFVRHSIKDVTDSVVLPPVYQKAVGLAPGYYDKLTMNLFIGAQAINAVTSERMDRDYMFHKDNKDSLRKLTNNLLRSAGFYWSGFSVEDVVLQAEVTLKHLVKSSCTPKDRKLLKKALKAAKTALGDETWKYISNHHEMVYYLTDFSSELGTGWALREKRPYKAHLYETTGPKIQGLQKSLNANPNLGYAALLDKLSTLSRDYDKPSPSGDKATPHTITSKTAVAPTLTVAPPRFPDLSSMPLLSAPKIAGTASRKLTYLLTQITRHQATEKILVFYEDQDVAWYLTQALEILGVETLAYASGLTPARKAAHLSAFQRDPKYRVLVMHLRQAAHGLNVTAATRIYFTAPVWRKDIEQQAIKRAHRIGQTREVRVETLYLTGTVEEAMLKRCKEMSERERVDAKNMVDDEAMCKIISEWEFIPMGQEGESENPACMLEAPEPLFGTGKNGGVYEDVDALRASARDPKVRVKKEKRVAFASPSPKRKRSEAEESVRKKGADGTGALKREDEDGSTSPSGSGSGEEPLEKRRVRFV